MVDAAPASRKGELREQLTRLYNTADPAKSVIRGCATNPPLSLAAFQSDPAFWNKWIDELIRANPKGSREEYSWQTYREVLRRGSEMMMPIWEKSSGKYGYISGQLDPRLITDVDRMIETAKEIRSIAPNIMVKVPASTQGVEVVRALTAMAIPTNVTACFTVPQAWAVANAAKEGLAVAE
jgi:transaldolase